MWWRGKLGGCVDPTSGRGAGLRARAVAPITVGGILMDSARDAQHRSGAGAVEHIYGRRGRESGQALQGNREMEHGGPPLYVGQIDG